MCCRNAIDSTLFTNWLRNLESETGILADGTMTLKQVLIQVKNLILNSFRCVLISI